MSDFSLYLEANDTTNNALSRDSYKDAFELLVGGSEILNNLTMGLSSAVGL